MCGALLDDDSRFCDGCGTPVADAPAAAPRAAPAPVAAARKVVTVLFGDLSGSTALEERMDAESVRSVLDRFYAGMRTEIERHGGRVVKFTGDGVMAAFGVPEVSEDDAARAVDAALAMREELEQLATDLGLDVGLKIGINTGEVVVSETDDDVVGDAVNVASRLEGAATAGEILVGEGTWRLTRGTSRYEPVEPLTLKGKSEPVPAYRLLSVDERTVDSAAAPFVGRETELGKLMAAFQDAVDSNAARLVTIIGSPGLGKTRLARELMNELADVARVRETRCDPAGSSTFAPIADALRAGTGFTETDSEEDVLAALADRFPEDDPDRERVAKLIGPLFGIGVPGSTEETFWALRRVIEAAAREQPVVFVLDDIHWAEPLLLDLIEHLHQWIRDAPVLLVGTARPELRDLRPSLTEGGQASSVIALEGLDRDATAKLAMNLLGTEELPSELLAKIPASTEGNPLFVRELVRMLVDDGVLLRTSDGWIVTVDVDAIEVPPTITSLLSARVERLRNDERVVVELASVIGKEFYRGALYDLAPAGVKDQVDGCLESLRRKELVEPAGTYWIDEPVYRFHHVLIRDAAYRRLLKESRADLHERVAGWLGNKTEDVLGEHEELLGYHLEQAHEYKQQLGRPDDELGRRAAELLQTAAQRALDRDDLPAAAALSGRALERLPFSAPERAELLLIRCEALLSMANVVDGSAAASELELVADSPRLRAWTTCFKGHLATLTAPERLQKTESLVAAAASELTELGDQAGAAKAHTVHASALAGLGRFGECEAVLDHALTAARAANDRRRITATLGSAPHAALWGPNPVSRAGGRCLDIVRLLRITTGSPAVEAASLRCQAVLEAFRGRADAARRMLRSARRTLEELGLQHELLETEQFAGIVELVAGDAVEAGSHLRTAHDGFRAVGVDVLAAQSAALLARAHLMLGEDAEAEAFIGSSEQAGTQDLKTAIAWRSVKAEILARRGELDEARRLAQEAVDLAERTDALIDHGNACRSLGSVLRAAGDAAGAMGAEDRALALFERKGATALTEGAVVQPITATPVQAQAPHAPATSALANSATRRIDRYAELFAQRDWSELERSVAEECVFDDRRPGMRITFSGAARVIGNIKVAAETGTARFEIVHIAVRGERLSLARWTAKGRAGPAGLETEILALTELDDQGRISALLTFSHDDVHGAIAELDDRYVLGEGAADPELVRLTRTWTSAYGDPDAMRSVFTDDLVVNDHRPAGMQLAGADAYIQWALEMRSLTEGFRTYDSAFHALAPGRAVTRREAHGMTNEGAVIEWVLAIYVEKRDGRICRFEVWPFEQLDAALARFGQVTGGSGELVHNRCARLLDEGMQRYESTSTDELPAFFRWLGSTHAESATQEDRRSGLGSVSVGRAEIVERFASLPVIPSQVRRSLLATRGERLALMQITFVSADDGFENEMLWLAELDGDDLFSAIVLFDREAIEAAVAELDERYIQGEGAVDPDTVRLISAAARSYGVEDVDLFRSHLTEDFVVVDHRPASGATNDLDGMLRWIEAAWELTSERTAYVASFEALAAGAALVRFEVHGITREGAEYETVLLIVFTRRGDRTAYVEQFLPEQIDLARTRFAELTSGGTEAVLSLGPLDTPATRSYVALADAFNSRDWAALEEVLDPSFVREDNRSGLQSTADRAGYIESARQVADLLLNARLTVTPLAVRGERFALIETLWSGDDANEVKSLAVVEVGEDGRPINAVNFDEVSFDEALTELEKRYVAGEGRSFADVVRGANAFTIAVNRSDWTAMRDLISDDFVLVDHRPGYWTERRGADEYEAYFRSGVDVFSSRRTWPSRYIRLSGSVALADGAIHGVTPDGARLDTSRLLILVVANGRLIRVEYLAPEALGDALARFADLASEAEASRSTLGPFENAATRLAASLVHHFNRCDWVAFENVFDASFVREDRRSGLRSSVGPHDYAESAKQLVELGLTDLSLTPIAIRGERLALTRMIIRTNDGNEMDLFVVYECGEDGRGIAVVNYDADNLYGALEDLDSRYVRGEGSAVAEMVWLGHRFAKAVTDNDWATMREIVTDDYTLVDHRPGYWTERQGVDEFRAYFESGAATAAARLAWLERYIRRTPSTSLVVARVGGTTSTGGEFDTTRLGVSTLRDGRIARMEYFPLDALSEAIARYDELERAQERPLDNRSMAVMRDVVAAAMSGQDEAHARFYSDTGVVEDRRKGLRAVVSGIQELMAFGRTQREAFSVRDYECIATRGERLALARGVWQTKDPESGFDAEVLRLSEIDDEDRVLATIFFDPDDLDAAIAELDERYIAGEAGSDIWPIAVSFTAAVDAANEEQVRTLLSDDFMLVDHRPASWGSIDGVEEFLRTQRTWHELWPVRRVIQKRVIAISSDVCLNELSIVGRSDLGGEVDTSRLALLKVRNGDIARLDYFPLDQVDEAMAVFDELARPRVSVELENAATRFVQRLQRAMSRGSLQEFVDLHAPSFILDDRRAGLRHVTRGLDQIRDYWIAAMEKGLDHAAHNETLAVRGDLLALSRRIYTRARDGAAFESERLIIDEVDADGRVVAAVFFDPDDLEAAFDELDRRYLAGEAVPFADVVRFGFRHVHATNDPDPTPIRALVADDVVLIDHRPASYGEFTGADELIRIHTSRVDLIPTWRTTVPQIIAVAEDRCLAELRIEGVTSEGAAVDTSRLGLLQIRDGLARRIEYFPLEQVDRALARFNELGPHPDVATLDNAAVRHAREVFARYERGDWDGLLDLYTPDHITEDMRTGLRTTYTGPQAEVENLKASRSVGVRLAALKPLALRGERLALIRHDITGPPDESAFDSAVLVLGELASDGRTRYDAVYDPDDLDAAFAALDERYAAALERRGEANDDLSAATVRSIARSMAAWNERDADTIADSFAETCVFVDCRPASHGRIEGGRGIAALAANLITPDMRHYVVAYHALDGRSCVIEMHGLGTNTEGGPVDVAYHHFTLFDADARQSYVERYAAADLRIALRRFEELRSGAPADAPDQRLKSVVIDVADAYVDAYNRRDWDAVARLSSPDSVRIDRRSGLRSEVEGRDVLLEAHREGVDLGLERATLDPIATRGAKLLLCRVRIVTQDGLETETLPIIEIDDDRLVSARIYFDPADIDAAFDELDNRYIAGEGAPFAAALEHVLGVMGAWNRRDWDTCRSHFAEDSVFIDRRPASFPEHRGVDAIIRLSQNLATPDTRHDIVAVHAISDTCGVFEFASRGTNAEGGEVESVYVHVARFRDGLLAYMERFSAADLDAALARYKELRSQGAVPVASWPPDTLAVRAGVGVVRCFQTGDIDLLTAHYAPDAVVEDVRPGLHATLTGREAIIENHRLLIAADAFEHTFLATRGERVSLSKFGVLAQGFLVEFLVLIEADADGLITRQWSYDIEDIQQTFDKLEELFAAGEGAPFRGFTDAGSVCLRAMNTRDWAAFRSCLSEDFVLHDHRPASLGVAPGADRRTEELRALYELFSEFRIDLEMYHAIAPDRAAGQMRGRGTTADGADVDIDYILVGVTRDRLITQMEIFPSDQVAAALARFDELGPRPDVFDTEAVRTYRRMVDAFARRDWDFFNDYYPEATEFEDRRPGLQVHFQGRDTAVENLRQVAANGAKRLAFEPIATRGEHLVLGTWRWDASEWDMEVLVVDEHNASGQSVRAVVFDPSDVDAAYQELVERYIAGEGAPFAGVLRLATDQELAYNARDWDAFRSRCREDMAFVDHRPAGAGTLIGPDPQVAYLTALIELAPDIAMRTLEIVTIAADRLLARLSIRGTSVEGAEIELTMYLLYVTADGRMARQEVFPIDQRDAATARFHELGPQPAAPAPTTLENAATRTWDAMCVTFAERRWDVHTDRVSDDVVVEDRRPGLQNVLRGRDEFLDVVRTISTITSPGPVLVAKVLAIRGDRLALFHETYAPPPDEPRDIRVELVEVIEVDAQGLLVGVASFEPDDLDAAVHELNERFVAGEGAPFAELLRANTRSLAAWNAGDWETLRSCFAPDVEFVDHRPLGIARRTGRDAVVSLPQAMTDLARGIRHMVARYHALRPDGLISEIHVTGTNEEGGAFENVYLHVAVFRDDLFAVVERFPVDRLDDALARLDELSTPVDPDVDHPCVRWMDRRGRLVAAGDWSAVTELYAEDVVFEDRRRGLGARIEGRTAVLEHARGVSSSMPMTMETTLVATRGKRLALLRGDLSITGDYDVAMLLLHELDAQGRQIFNGLFDPDDIDVAFDELERRYAVGEGVDAADELQRSIRFVTAIRNRDWSSYRALLADDFVLFDHRPVSLGEVRGADEWIATTRSLIDTIPDFRLQLVRYHAIEDGLLSGEVRAWGTNVEGSEVEICFHVVFQSRDGQYVRFEFFSVDQKDAAFARFHELGPRADTDTRALENEAIRLTRESFDAFARRDWAFFAATLADDVLLEDRRQGVGTIYRGRDAVMENIRQTVEIGVRSIDYEALAVRGELLHLGRTGWTVDDFVLETISLMEIDNEGRGVRTVLFDPDDLDIALNELDERYIAGEGAAGAEFVRLQRATLKAMNAADWDAYRSLLADDLQVIDHRPASGDIRDAEGFVRGNRTLYEVMGGYRIRIAEILRARGPMGVSRLVIEGRNSEGGIVEMDLVAVARFVDGLLKHFEEFPTDRIDDALARYEELTAQRHVLRNACVEVMEREDEIVRLRDWDALRALCAEDVSAHDRRQGLGADHIGRDAVVQVWIEIDAPPIGAVVREREVIALRGDRFALARQRFGSRIDATGFEAEVLLVTEVDAQSRLRTHIAFDPDDLDRALSELDERFLPSDEATDAGRIAIAFTRAYNARDWQWFAENLTDDYMLFDNRPASLGEIDKDTWVSVLRSFADAVEDRRFMVLTTQSPTTASLLRSAGTDAYGNAVEWDYWTVWETRDGKFCRGHAFSLDAKDDADAKVREIAQRPKRLENATTRIWSRFEAAWNAGRWDGTGDEVSADVVVDDRRSGLSSLITGRDGYLAQMRVLADMGPAAKSEIHAIRGERLSLQTLEWFDARGRTGAVVRSLHLHESDDEGWLAHIVVFDPEDIDAAYAELDERFLASDEATEHHRRQADFVSAHNARDWDRFRALFTEDHILEDHRPSSFGELVGPDAFIGIAKSAIEMVPDRRFTILATQTDRSPSLLRAAGTDVYGNAVVWDFLSIFVDRAGKLCRTVAMAHDATDAAHARARELFSPPPRDRLVNAALDALHRFAETFERQDWDDLERLLAPEMIRIDHRRGISGTNDRDEFIEGCKVLVGLSYASVRFEAIATRGDRLGLSRGAATGSHDYESDAFVLVDTTEDGRVSYLAWFDPDDLDRALDELDERFMSGEGAPHMEVIRVHRALRHAVNERRFDDFRDLLADDIVFIDHRLASLGAATREQLTEGVRVLCDLIPDVRQGWASYSALDVDKWWASGTMEGTSTEGAQVDLNTQSVGRVENGRISRFEFFPDDATQEASAAFEALSVKTDRFENDAFRALRRGESHAMRGEWDAMMELVAEDAVWEDRRRGFGWRWEGRAEIREQLQTATPPNTRYEETPIATRGSRLVLTHQEVFVRDFEVVNTLVYEIDESGCGVRCVFFDPDDIDAAFDEIGTRYAGGEGARFAHLLTEGGPFAPFMHPDARLVDVFDPNVVFVDHRLASAGEFFGLDGFREFTSALHELATDVREDTVAIHRIYERGLVLQSLVRGTNSEGGPIEIAVLYVVIQQDGRIVRIEILPVEQLDAALARFDELTSG